LGLIIAASSQHDEFSCVIAGPTADLLGRTSLDQIRINVLPGRAACLSDTLERLASLATPKLPFDRIGSLLLGPSSIKDMHQCCGDTKAGYGKRMRKKVPRSLRLIDAHCNGAVQERRLSRAFAPDQLKGCHACLLRAARWPFQRAGDNETDLMSVCSSQLRRTAAVLALRAAPHGSAVRSSGKSPY
jgi:hypothetical protein